MSRFKEYDYNQTVMLPVDFKQQILPGTFDYSLHYLVDNELDLSLFNSKFRNDDNGSPAYDPAILLKIVLLAYSRGVTSSRKIEALCRENVVFMAISADSHPHFTTIAEFISGSSEQIDDLFGQVLMTCDALGLIGKEMFADHGFRARDPRFATASRHKAKEPPRPKTSKTLFTAQDFHADLEKQTCICPAGKTMWLKCSRARIKSHIFMQFMGHQADCDGCRLRLKCLRNPGPKAARQVHILLGRAKMETDKTNPIERMKQKIDTAFGRHTYSQRLGIVEPVFGNLRETLGLRRFSLRGRTKVDAQWKLMTMIHNIFKIHRYGWAL